MCGGRKAESANRKLHENKWILRTRRRCRYRSPGKPVDPPFTALHTSNINFTIRSRASATFCRGVAHPTSIINVDEGKDNHDEELRVGVLHVHHILLDLDRILLGDVQAATRGRHLRALERAKHVHRFTGRSVRVGPTALHLLKRELS